MKERLLITIHVWYLVYPIPGMFRND